MKRGFSFELKVGAIMLVLLVLVTVIGVYTYERFSKIVTSVSEASRPDFKLVTAKGLSGDLTRAENSVKSYSLTKDTFYLSEFYRVHNYVEDKLLTLDELTASSEDSASIDSLHYYIGLKFEILNDLLELQDDYRVREALDKAADKIHDVAEMSTIRKEAEKKRKGLFSWGKKKEEEPVEVLNEGKVAFSDVKNQLQSVQLEEDAINRSIVVEELALIMRDKKVTRKISSIITMLEISEVNEIKAMSLAAEKEVKATNNQIAMFCVAIGILLFFMAYTIIKYVQNNNQFKYVLRKAKIDAEDLAKSKEKFVANISHEIRTPMNAIAGFTEQIAKGPLTTEQREHMEVVQKSTDHLLYLINEVLDLSKLQNDKLTLEKIAFNPTQLVKNLCESTQLSAEKKGIKINDSISLEQNRVLIGDPYRLNQILMNLLSNAVKFTDKGMVSLNVQSLLQSKKGLVMRIEVIDTGIGMNADQLQKVFEEFEQADVSTTRNYGGTGLGLAITKRLVDLHNGNIHILSEPNKGTKVTVELPYEIGEETQVVEEKKLSSTNVDLKGYKILVVDDEAFNRKLVLTILKKTNASLTEARNGLEALKAIEIEPFDLVLMDALMPEMGGLEATVKIREMEDDKKANTPIIALTAVVGEDEVAQFKRSGITAHIPKPVSEEKLINGIIKTLKIEVSNEVQFTSTEVLNKTDRLDYSELERISNGDSEFYTEMLSTFINGTSEGMENIRNAVKKDDYKVIAEEAHRISSPCKHLSANKLHSLFKELEENCRHGKNLASTREIVSHLEHEVKNALLQVEKELKKTKTVKDKL